MRVDEHTSTLDQAPAFVLSAPAPGIPPLYLHGVPTSSEDWRPLLERTGGIAPDLPGFGRSAKGAHLDYSADGHAVFLERLLGELGVERVALVAHDWGAAGGLTFAIRHPERVAHVVLINPLVRHDHRPGARMWRRPGVGELAMGATTKWMLARALRAASVRRDAWGADRIAQVWQQFDQGTQRAILRLYRSGWTPMRPGLDTHVFWGAEDPWLERPAGVGMEVIDGAGHWPWLDRPELIERIAEVVLG